jgi:hypothetical protein
MDKKVNGMVALAVPIHTAFAMIKDVTEERRRAILNYRATTGSCLSPFGSGFSRIKGKYEIL